MEFTFSTEELPRSYITFAFRLSDYFFLYAEGINIQFEGKYRDKITTLQVEKKYEENAKKIRRFIWKEN